MDNKTKLGNYDFTFYGDLLGISNLYSIDQYLAKDNLDKFYNLVFEKFKVMAEDKKVKIFIFSDSVFITGCILEETLTILGQIYVTLFYKNIFFRGAIVKGRLDFDPRIELENFKKQLPSTDVLFRAVSLEKSVNGMRLLIEPKIAKEVLPKEWLTEDKYKENVDIAGYDKFDFRRKIVLASEWNAYEYLWPLAFQFSELLSGGIAEFASRLMKRPDKIIEERLQLVPNSVKIHLEETKNIFKRSSYRYMLTDKVLNLSSQRGDAASNF